MCGIAGIWNSASAFATGPQFDAFVDIMAHRGPDDRGVWRNESARISLGHRRLSILDLSPDGRQPMVSRDGRYVIVFNGEVFNFLELRRELEAQGHHFRTGTDTEVLLAAFVQWGEACQLKCNGMWAFAIWDCQERTLFLSRDRFGIKPMHYVSAPGLFAFASEMKAFLRLPGFAAELDHELIAETLMDMTTLEGTDHCLLKDVSRLKAGHCLTMKADGSTRIKRWWDTLEHIPAVPRSFPEQVECFKELFLDACRIRMRCDVPVATSLSGGLDSSSVLCALHALDKSQGSTERRAPDWQRAFVACFPGTNLDETAYARTVIESTGAVPVFQDIQIEPYLDQIESMIFQFEELYPVLQAGLWFNYKGMRDRGVRVSLDGHGADESIGGYVEYVWASLSNALLPVPRPGRFLDMYSTLAGFIGGSNQVNLSLPWVLRRSAGHYLSCSPAGRRFVAMFRRLAGKVPPAVPGFLRGPITNPRNLVRAALLDRPELRRLSPLGRELYIAFHYTTLPTILRHFDRASMGHGVEIRMPFMDWRLITFEFGLPDESRIGQGFSKRILREAMTGLMPESIRTRTNKIGFTSPMPSWFSGPLRQFLLDTVASEGFINSPVWDGPELKRFVEHLVDNGAWDSLGQIWPYLNAHILEKTFNQAAMRQPRG
ncbi:MAG: asparagine synthase (glutamine-hydrolyzing) [Humidesulfovibrio sp.]|nr:asparagine synthase (glutamine-hydrolyzing) [Humidesulfovibrio sp.]